uniref:Predicted TIM-barrel enzyme n=1 Tax=uncultured bacterium HF186_25m_13D19 TaxID=662888 RepID=C7FPG6_9BACT|nr:predicted TIM-barrel enzyme [uncultured bacterium HF186_25m_13D19]
MDAVLKAAIHDAEALIAGGMDGYVVENFGDAPFYPEQVGPETVAAMARALALLPRGDVLVGCNVLRNDAQAALGLASAFDLDFIRVNVHIGAALTDQGIIEGRAATTLRTRARLGARAALFADVDVKHASPLGEPRPLGLLAEETAARGRADALIVSGSQTGAPTSITDMQAVKAACPEVPLLIGSGMTLDGAAEALAIADGAIVGTALKRGGQVYAPVCAERVAAFVGACR